MNSEVLNRIQHMSDELAIRKERERLLKWEIDSNGYISEYAARKILNYATAVKEPQESLRRVSGESQEREEESEEVAPPKNPMVKHRIQGEPAQKKWRVDRAQVMALKRSGKTAGVIAKELGCSVATVHSVWKEDRG
jgi:DNA-binding NarL/FixJ family response regulator